MYFNLIILKDDFIHDYLFDTNTTKHCLYQLIRNKTINDF